MTNRRFKELMEWDSEAALTQDEIAEGWHFCVEFDGLLVNFNDRESEGQFCTDACRPEAK